MTESLELPEDMAPGWQLTSWSLKSRAWNLHIALAIYPAPACYEIARRYEAALAAAQERLAVERTKKPARQRKKPVQAPEQAQPVEEPKEQQQMLWQEPIVSPKDDR